MAESKNKSNTSESRDVAQRAVEQVAELIEHRIEAVTGLEKDGSEWTVTLEVLELERIPSTTDVLGRYEVKLDKDGELTGLQRTRRYPRAEAGEV
jgi:Gas vesicle synthesis protein GvpO